MPRPNVGGLEWDDENEAHLARHHVYPDAVEEVLAGGRWVLVANTGRRSRRRRLIGRDSRGRMWTVVVEPTGRRGIWRPITGWLSTPGEAELYSRRGV